MISSFERKEIKLLVALFSQWSWENSGDSNGILQDNICFQVKGDEIALKIVKLSSHLILLSEQTLLEDFES